MATPRVTRSTEESWDLSIEELIKPMTEMPRLGGPGPFVINLCTATSPIDISPQMAAAFAPENLYLIQRTEDHRLRYRLRLGAFTTEDAADAMLLKVREIYPCALTATAGDDDLRAIAALQPRTPSARTPVARAPVATAPIATAPVSTAPFATAPFATAPLATAPLATAPAPAPASAPVRQTPPPSNSAASAPGVRPSAPSVTPTPGASPARVASPTPGASPARVVSPTPVASPAPVATPSSVRAPTPVQALPMLAPVRAAVQSVRAPVPTPATRAPSLETTQTVRPLTSLELDQGGDGSRWFAIQLSTAEQPFDPDELPSLDIFNVYRLYSVAGHDQGRVRHALRLGFFTEEIAARAVASYLAGYYANATVRRVSLAERDRFGQRRVEARKDVGATGNHAVIEITNERVVRPKRNAALNAGAPARP